MASNANKAALFFFHIAIESTQMRLHWKRLTGLVWNLMKKLCFCNVLDPVRFPVRDQILTVVIIRAN